MFAVSPSNLHRWILPSSRTGSLLAILLFLFPIISGDTSLNSPLGYSLWSVWTNSTTDSGSTTTNNPLVGLWNVFTNSAADTQDHSYCLLVPLMVGYLIYDKRKELASLPVAGTSIGCCGSCWASSFLARRARWQAVPRLRGRPGAADGHHSLVLGRAFFRKLFFAGRSLPSPGRCRFSIPRSPSRLRMLVSHSAYIVLNLVGVHTVQSGTALLSAPFGDQPLGARFQIDVADPCSGLHSLLPLLMFSAFYCYFFLTKAWHQWLVFLSAFVFAIAGNVVRILLLVFGCLLWGREFAIGTTTTRRPIMRAPGSPCSSSCWAWSAFSAGCW
ncbi:MAG: exosortase/archaeosortase family protein [Verrucomicrobiota bacterium]